MNAFGAVRARIDAAATRAGRDPGSVMLLGASKTVSPAEILGVVRQGLTCVGENRVQELLAKQHALADEPDAAALRWDLIGPLQRNKVNKVVGRVHLIHSVDSLQIARAVGHRAVALGIEQEILVEVNTSGEASKHGVGPDEAVDLGAAASGIDGVAVRGLMTVAAPGDLDRSRGCFRMLASIRAAEAWPAGADELSMGMTDDLEVAVEEGATIVRVGTALFGARCDAGLGA